MTTGCNIWMICLKLNWFFTVKSYVEIFWICMATKLFGMGLI